MFHAQASSRDEASEDADVESSSVGCGVEPSAEIERKPGRPRGLSDLEVGFPFSSAG